MAGGLKVRTMVVVAGALLVAVLTVRVAVVRAFAEAAPATAVRLWSSHPQVAVSAAMEEIGRAAAQGRDPPPASLSAITGVAARAPLAPEPFLVRGIIANQTGQAELAERAFVAARLRAPREQAPRYFLAELYLGSGRGAEGLREIATLARLLPQGARSVAPAVAAFAQTPGAERQLRPVFRSDPALARAVLAELAKDAANAELILSLAGPVAEGAETPSWAPRLLGELVAAGDFRRAHDLWRKLGGEVGAGEGIHDPAFQGSRAPPPFNWTFAAGDVGLAEPDNGALHIIYYGRRDGPLASQLLVLRAGRYRFAFNAAGSAAARGALQWRLTCLPGRNGLLRVPLTATQAAEFQVASNCPAQRLEVVGTAGDVASEADVAITKLDLRRSGP